MKATLVALVCLASIAASGDKRPEFVGVWEFNAAESKNVGMMSQMKMKQTIRQTESSLDVLSQTTFQGSDQDLQTHYDLAGKPVTNDSPMAGPSETISKWDGNKIVTTWTSQSAVAGGEKVVRTETRSLSPDGNRMTVESIRGSNPPVVIVFDKKR